VRIKDPLDLLARHQRSHLSIEHALDLFRIHAKFVRQPAKRSAAQAIMKRLLERRARCQRQTNSFVTPMGLKADAPDRGAIMQDGVLRVRARSSCLL
jgi:hypothetical protein